MEDFFEEILFLLKVEEVINYKIANNIPLTYYENIINMTIPPSLALKMIQKGGRI